MLCAGVDIGSLWTKAVLMESGELRGWGIVPTGDNNTGAARAALGLALQGRGLSALDIASMAVTGAGRASVALGGERPNEMVCAARGIRFVQPGVRGVVDMGAESTRAVKLDGSGDIVDYAVNDKCASGTGVFLDAMAKVMGVPVEEMGPLSLSSTADVEITSACVVFAESEVISQVHRRTPKRDIVKGINKSIAARVFGLLNRLDLEGDSMAIGGLAQNSGIVSCLEAMMNRSLPVPERPMIVSALGAALVAAELGGGA